MSPPTTPTTLSDTVAPVKSVAFPSRGETITSESSGISYIIGHQIGEGHFGVVYECTDSWGNELAAKILKPLGTYDEVREKAEAEFVKLVAVRCPYITFIYDAFEFRDTFYLITERCHNTVERLLQLENFDGRLWILPIARCLLQALHYMHVSGLVHQDIHLGNVFVSFTKDEMTGDANQSMHFKVADLGVAKLMAEVDATNTRAQWMLPPEVLDSAEFGPIGHQVDIYHAALLLLQVALGSPVQFTQQEMLEGKPRELALGLEPPLNFALEKALRRHVLYRTANAMEFWRDLNSLPSLPESDVLQQSASLPILGEVSV